MAHAGHSLHDKQPGVVIQREAALLTGSEHVAVGRRGDNRDRKLKCSREESLFVKKFEASSLLALELVGRLRDHVGTHNGDPPRAVGKCENVHDAQM